MYLNFIYLLKILNSKRKGDFEFLVLGQNFFISEIL